ncbi:MAG: hypothetical protein LBF12_00125 [Christensenellaceae bacterium]|jgi:hypothetical protein|nr:hypothetical protein [Christensenellaceae bacterium]
MVRKIENLQIKIQKCSLKKRFCGGNKFASISKIGKHQDAIFEILNTKHSDRKTKCKNDPTFEIIPYLNGGLFSPYDEDYFKYDTKNEAASKPYKNTSHLVHCVILVIENI